MIAARTAVQLDGGHDFAPDEFIGPVTGFVILAPIALAIAALILEAVGLWWQRSAAM